MMKRNLLYCLAIGCLAFGLAASLRGQGAESRSAGDTPTQWQHLALHHDGKSISGDPELSRKIVQLGNDGWELVDVETVVEAGTTIRTVFFFKKPR